jgi:hypothetical protein
VSIKYHKKILWFKPFVDSVPDLVDLGRITHIRAFKVRPEFEEQTNGSAIKYRNKYSINILTHYYLKAQERYQHRTLGTVLEDLAHELAHVGVWEHLPNHFKLQSEIQVRFAQVLEDLGIKDHSVRMNDKLAREIVEASDVK